MPNAISLAAVAVAALSPSLASAEISGKIHHPEAWMFDTKPITSTVPTKSDVSFKITEHLYARVFYDKAIKDVFHLAPGKTAIEIAVDVLVPGENNIATFDIWVAPKDLDARWIDLEILPDPKTAHTKYEGWTFVEALRGPVLNHHTTGSHKVWFDIDQKGSGIEDDADKRAATITIDFTGTTAAKLAATDEAVKAAGDKAYAANISLPKPGRVHNAALAKQAATLMRDSDTVRMSVVFTDDEWEIERDDDTNRVMARTTGAAVVWKSKDGTCHVSTTEMLRQKYVGGKFRAPGEWANMSSDSQVIDCGKAFGTKARARAHAARRR